MTKQRQPVSFAAAIHRVAGFIGYKHAGKIVRRAPRRVYAWADPDSDSSPTLRQALALDLAYQQAGGVGAPIIEAYRHQLDGISAKLAADRRALSDEIADAARECGEAIAHSLSLTHDAPTPRDIRRAVAEAEEAHRSTGALLRRLFTFLPGGAGPLGTTGGSQRAPRHDHACRPSAVRIATAGPSYAAASRLPRPTANSASTARTTNAARLSSPPCRSFGRCSPA